jgi:hypothetical protein
MKKIILTIMLLGAFLYGSSQDLKSKSGFAVLPEAGDWSIGFDALPVINYFGNVFHSPSGSMGAYSPAGYPMTIVGKWVKDDGMAWRGKLRIGFGSNSQDSIFNDPHSTANPPATYTNSYKNGHTNITLGFGMQKYMGAGRVQGYYGAEAWFGMASTSTTNTLGTTADSLTVAGPFVTSSSSGTTIMFGVRGFVGVEFFFAPKMSIGAEYGWGLGLSSTGSGSVTYEQWDFINHNLRTTTAKTGGSSAFGIDVDNGGNAVNWMGNGSINLSFYF